MKQLEREGTTGMLVVCLRAIEWMISICCAHDLDLALQDQTANHPSPSSPGPSEVGLED